MQVYPHDDWSMCSIFGGTALRASNVNAGYVHLNIPSWTLIRFNSTMTYSMMFIMLNATAYFIMFVMLDTVPQSHEECEYRCLYQLDIYTREKKMREKGDRKFKCHRFHKNNSTDRYTYTTLGPVVGFALIMMQLAMRYQRYLWICHRYIGYR